MALSTVENLFDDISRYPHAVVAFVGTDGFPINAATSFRVDAQRSVIELDRPALPAPPAEGAEVNILFSHVRPYPGVGYDQRRYVSVWGRVRNVSGVLEVTPSRSHGWDEERMSFFELCERSVPTARAYLRRLSIQRGEEVKPTLPVGWLIFLATRIPFLTATIVPVLLGAVIARFHGASSWWLTVLTLVGAALIHLGLNVGNDVADATSGADEANVNPTMYSGGSRVIQYGLVSLDAMKKISIACYAIGIAIGLYLAATRGWELLLVGAAGLFLAIFYTAPPLRLVNRGLGELCVALGFGPIMVLGSYFVVAQRFSGEAFYASLPVALLIMLVLYVNQIPDRPADEKAHKRTIVVRLKQSSIVTGYALSAGAAFALIALGPILGITPWWSLIALGSIPLAVRVYRALDPHYNSPYELMSAMGVNIMLHFSAGMLLIIGYIVAIIV
jgi:1,4-dihydroxy-2-naphthoate polyprenyltransferase